MAVKLLYFTFLLESTGDTGTSGMSYILLNNRVGTLEARVPTQNR